MLLLAPTNACNLACAHCYREEEGAFSDELSPIEVVRVLREFAGLARSLGRNGVVAFSGGEPLLARHLGLYCRTALGLDLGVRVNTNAVLTTSAVARGLFAWGVRYVQVSLDGSTQEDHEAIRGAGTWELARRGVRNLASAGITVVIKVTLVPGRNDHDPAGFLGVARAWGVGVVSFARVVPLGSGSDLRCYAPEAYRKVLERITWERGMFERSSVRATRSGPPRAAERGAVPAEGATGARTGGRHSVVAEIRDATFDRSFLTGDPHGYSGEEGHSVLAIDADGTAYVSRRLPLPIGNVRRRSLEELWAHPVLVKLRDGTPGGKCARCDLRATCRGGSRSVAWAATGDPLAPDPACWVGDES